MITTGMIYIRTLSQDILMNVTIVRENNHNATNINFLNQQIILDMDVTYAHIYV